MFPPVSVKQQPKTVIARQKRNVDLPLNGTVDISDHHNHCEHLKLPLLREERIIHGRKEVYFNTRQ
jgi:hypothetical protein